MAWRQLDPGIDDRPDDGLEPVDLDAGAARVLDRLEVGPQPAQPAARCAGDAPCGVDHRGVGEPAAAQSGLDLELHVERRIRRRRPAAAASSSSSRTGSLAVTEMRPRAASAAHADRDRVEHQDRPLHAARAQLQGLVHRGDAEPVGAGGLEGPGDRHRAVAVGVGLDDRTQRDARDRQADGAGAGSRRARRDRSRATRCAAGPAIRRRPGGLRSAGASPRAPASRAARSARSPAGRTAPAVGWTGSGAASRAAKPSRLPLDLRSARAARRFRAMASPSGRSEASRPASPSRSRTDSPDTPCR